MTGNSTSLTFIFLSLKSGRQFRIFKAFLDFLALSQNPVISKFLLIVSFKSSLPTQQTFVSSFLAPNLPAVFFHTTSKPPGEFKKHPD